jgi:hypothetical protein
VNVPANTTTMPIRLSSMGGSRPMYPPAGLDQPDATLISAASESPTGVKNGVIVHETFSGTFTLNADCTGTAVVNVFQGGTLVRSSPLDFVAIDDQNEIHAIVLTEGTAVSATIKRISRADE